jgi:hypothetical protein
MMKWDGIFDEFKQMRETEQLLNKARIVEAVRRMWAENPTEKEFGSRMGGIVLFPEILHIMAFQKKELEDKIR